MPEYLYRPTTVGYLFQHNNTSTSISIDIFMYLNFEFKHNSNYFQVRMVMFLFSFTQPLKLYFKYCQYFTYKDKERRKPLLSTKF